MPRPKLAVRPTEKKVNIPSDVAARVDLALFSELEGRVPHGAWSRLMEGLLREWLGRVTLDAELATALESLVALSQGDHEIAHGEADKLLLAELNRYGYSMSVDTFNRIKRRYA